MIDTVINTRDKCARELPIVTELLAKVLSTDYQQVIDSLSDLTRDRGIADAVAALQANFNEPHLRVLADILFKRFNFSGNKNIASVQEGGILPDLISNAKLPSSDRLMDCKLPTFALCQLLSDFCQVAIEVDRNPLDMNHPSALVEAAGQTVLVDFTFKDSRPDLVTRSVSYPITKLMQVQPRLFLPYNADTIKFFDLIYLMFIIVDLLERSHDSKNGRMQRELLIPLCESVWSEMYQLYPNNAVTKFYSTFAATAKTWDE